MNASCSAGWKGQKCDVGRFALTATFGTLMNIVELH